MCEKQCNLKQFQVEGHRRYLTEGKEENHPKSNHREGSFCSQSEMEAKNGDALSSRVRNLRFIACQPSVMQNYGCFTKFRANQLKKNSPFPTHVQCKCSAPTMAHPYSSSPAMPGAFSGQQQSRHHSKSSLRRQQEGQTGKIQHWHGKSTPCKRGK